MIIDSHAHFVPQTLLEEIRDVIRQRADALLKDRSLSAPFIIISQNK